MHSNKNVHTSEINEIVSQTRLYYSEMENFSRERIALCLLVGGVLLTCGYGTSLAGVQRREVPCTVAQPRLDH